MRLKRLCLAATVAGLLSGCAASRSASVNLVEQVDVPPSHSQQYNPRKTARGAESAEPETEDRGSAVRGKSVSRSRVTETTDRPYEATDEELDDYIVETGLLTRLRDRDSECTDDGCDTDSSDSPLCNRLRERFRERRQSGPYATPFLDRLRDNFRGESCSDDSRHPLCDRLRERLRGEGDHPLCDRLRDRLHGEGDHPLCDRLRSRLNGEGERPLCDALTAIFCCEVPDGPWPFCGTETWEPVRKDCRCSSTRKMPQGSVPSESYDLPGRPSENLSHPEQFQTPSNSTPPAVPDSVPMPNDVPEVPEGALPEILPGNRNNGQIVEPPLWFRIREQKANPDGNPAPESAPEPTATPDPVTEPAPEPQPEPAPEPSAPVEPAPVPPADEAAAEPMPERPELPPLPQAEPQSGSNLPSTAPPPVPGPRLRQTRTPRGNRG